MNVDFIITPREKQEKTGEMKNNRIRIKWWRAKKKKKKKIGQKKA